MVARERRPGCQFVRTLKCHLNESADRSRTDGTFEVCQEPSTAGKISLQPIDLQKRRSDLPGLLREPEDQRAHDCIPCSGRTALVRKIHGLREPYIDLVDFLRLKIFHQLTAESEIVGLF